MIEIFRKLFRRTRTKEKLIRTLVRRRAESDPVAMRLGDADRIPDFVLMRLPEATIVGIVETYWRRKRQDPYLSDKKIFEAIEAQRLRVIEKRAMPCPLTLSSYIKYRIGIEHTGAAPIMGNFVEEAIEEANKVLGPR